MFAEGLSHYRSTMSILKFALRGVLVFCLYGMGPIVATTAPALAASQTVHRAAPERVHRARSQDVRPRSPHRHHKSNRRAKARADAKPAARPAPHAKPSAPPQGWRTRAKPWLLVTGILASGTGLWLWFAPPTARRGRGGVTQAQGAAPSSPLATPTPSPVPSAMTPQDTPDDRFARARAEYEDIWRSATPQVGGLPEPQTGPAEPQQDAKVLAKEARWLTRQLRVLEKVAHQNPRSVVARRLINQEEQKVFWMVLGWVKGRGLRLQTQVSMGEFLAAGAIDHDAVRNAFNAKRVDFLICDRHWMPLMVVEHQGGGHWQGNYELRDAIKRRALGSARIGLVTTGDQPLAKAVLAQLDAELARVRAERDALAKTTSARRASSEA